jgi:hypothetical protein
LEEHCPGGDGVDDAGVWGRKEGVWRFEVG